MPLQHRSDPKSGFPTPGDEFTLLAITAFRADEIRMPVAAMNAESVVITVDHASSAPERVTDALRQTRRAIEKHDPDLLLLDSYGTIGLPAAVLAMRNDIPIVARLVSDIWRRLDEERLQPARNQHAWTRYAYSVIRKRLYELVLQRAVGFVTVSTELKTTIANQTDCPPDRIAVVPIPLTGAGTESCDVAEAREVHGITEPRVLLTVTNLKFRAKFEGVTRILEEVRPLLRANPDLAYVVAGGGQYHDELLKTVADLFPDPEVRQRIYTPGHVTEVAYLYALADIFVYVSYLDGYPNAVLEAQAAGLPVVANEAHGMCDQITDGETGYLVDSRESGAFRERVTSLLAGENKRKRLGDAAQRRVRRENDPQTISTHLEEFLSQITRDLSR